MADEIAMTQEQWESMLAAQIERTKPKPPTPKQPKASTKPYDEKSFVSVHYVSSIQSDNDTRYASRNKDLYVLLHFYMRDGDTWPALQRDARNYASTWPNCKIVCHDHLFTEPCSPAPKLRKCREV